MTATTATPLIDRLRKQIDLQQGEKLYAVIDAARDIKLLIEARTRFGEAVKSLFQGEAAASMADFAPYLVRFGPADEFLDVWAEHWGNSAGILLISQADPTAILKHLRSIFIVQDEQGQEYFFRFYDPRVLRTFLLTCAPGERAEFFGPLRVALYEAEEPANILKSLKAE